MDLRVWPTFNAADAAITIEVMALLLGALFGPEKPLQRTSKRKE